MIIRIFERREAADTDYVEFFIYLEDLEMFFCYSSSKVKIQKWGRLDTWGDILTENFKETTNEQD